MSLYGVQKLEYRRMAEEIREQGAQALLVVAAEHFANFFIREAGQGGFEIRTYIAVAGAAGGEGIIRFLEPIPIFATCGVVASMAIA